MLFTAYLFYIWISQRFFIHVACIFFLWMSYRAFCIPVSRTVTSLLAFIKQDHPQMNAVFPHGYRAKTTWFTKSLKFFIRIFASVTCSPFYSSPLLKIYGYAIWGNQAPVRFTCLPHFSFNIWCCELLHPLPICHLWSHTCCKLLRKSSKMWELFWNDFMGNFLRKKTRHVDVYQYGL